MEVSSRLLIISPFLPAPVWIQRLAEKLRLSGIATDVTSEFNSSQIPDKCLVLHLASTEKPHRENVLSLHITTTRSRFKKGLSILELNEGSHTNRTLIYRTELSAFRSVDEEQTQCIYFLEKAIKMRMMGVSSPPDKERPDKASSHFTKLIFTKTVRFFQRDNWFCNVINAPIEVVALSKSRNSQTAILPSDKNILMADPFGVIYQDQEFILFERQEKGKKGEIACLNNGEVTEILKTECHLSYPFLLECEGTIYCIPEKQETGKLDLYNFDPEKRSLTFNKTILNNFSASDPTLVRYQNKYWLFCTDTTDYGANSRLHLFYADHPEGDWTHHRLNPIKISVRGSRPGGTLFEHKGHLYRPGQNSAETYGGSLIIYRIDTLTESEFSETEVNELFPGDFGSGFAGIHTLSRLGNKTLIDLKQKVFSFRNILHYLRKT